uniref:Protein kinase domain-containing protein n=1 Tax=Oryza rufipogon TaxID=4529 RepID=A0A0E0QNS8_ORYRU
MQLENRRFTYKDLQKITNNFEQVLGKGGFGYVYYGILEEGSQVAVKLRSQSSNQGVKEFLGEAQILTRIHHKNLVSMIGYCMDGDYMALVYEYMSEGTLEEHIAGRDHNKRNLTWIERLRIALESAQGLEYLHKGCSPPLIHRDVKATNILLNLKLEAKIADFGLSKAFNRDSDTHVSASILAGTPGYIDPEYHATMMPTAKSDVYGFGVVLLELVTGKNPILRTPEPISLIHWVQQRLQCGNIEGVVDTRMHGVYDINSVWKVAEIALKCTAQASTQRPTMTDVVVQLQECLDLEYGHASSVPELSIDHVSKTRTILEMDHLERLQLSTVVEKMAARSCLHLLIILAAGVLQAARAQPDSDGFISIDCGLSGTAGYVDNATKLSYSPDAAFTDAGTNNNISVEYFSPANSRIFDNVRSFPSGAAPRSCYTLSSLVAGLKYLVRANFMYGNYDGLRRPPVFDLYSGVNFWRTVNITDAAASITAEAIIVVPEDSMQVCLLNTGAGTPFISGLDLRPLKNSLYPQANATQGLVMVDRVNYGPTDTFIRYPDDPRDRGWRPLIDTTRYVEVSTTKTVQNVAKDLFEAPSAVMQTAITPRNASDSIEVYWTADPSAASAGDPPPGYIAIMHFSELQLVQGNAVRAFNISLNDEWLDRMMPDYLYADADYNTVPFRGSNRYNLTFRATANSTLPPIINALEIFSVIPTTNVPTYAKDVSGITAIKKQYEVKQNWMGDPCVPKTLAWDWLTCSYAISSSPTITGVNLSYNLLTGSIPKALSQLSSLKVLYENNLDLCINDTCPSPNGKPKLAIYISVPVVAVTVILVRKTKGSANNIVNPHSEPTSHSHGSDSYGHGSIQLENRRFTYKDLQMITNNFEQVLGKGGFGYVYYGILEEGTQVAVKLRSQSSNQGVKEFLREAQILTRIHHKNLVSMIGYCKDGEYMALVYEYMSEGTLEEHIAGRDRNKRNITWTERLRIALESAQGLEYLHKGCSPPLIHRDVKATNILLNMKLEAKIADFGLSKAFNHDSDTHVSTSILVGTPGYIDPEYHATMMPTTKSDVYGFGMVLLELVTGKSPILRTPEPISLIHWAQQRLQCGNIDAVVDARMHGVYDVNSVWKVTEIALKCTAQASAHRPMMTDVVAKLQECLDLEHGRAGSVSELSIDHVSKTNTIFEMGHLEKIPLPTMSSSPSTR